MLLRPRRGPSAHYLFDCLIWETRTVVLICTPTPAFTQWRMPYGCSPHVPQTPLNRSCAARVCRENPLLTSQPCGCLKRRISPCGGLLSAHRLVPPAHREAFSCPVAGDPQNHLPHGVCRPLLTFHHAPLRLQISWSIYRQCLLRGSHNGDLVDLPCSRNNGHTGSGQRRRDIPGDEAQAPGNPSPPWYRSHLPVPSQKRWSGSGPCTHETGFHQKKN